LSARAASIQKVQVNPKAAAKKRAGKPVVAWGDSVVRGDSAMGLILWFLSR
jgi:hypothetical protein